MRENLLTAIAVLAVLAAAGCASGPGEIAGSDLFLPDDAGSAGYLDRISSEPTVSENDAFRGMLYLTEGSESAWNFQQRVQALRDKGIIPAGWDCHAQRPLTRGRMAYMVYQAADMPGGVTLKLTGPNQWYCLRELKYQGLVAEEASILGEVTGMEFVAVLGRAAEYKRTGSVPRVLSTKGGQ